jgi:hypothetical protein
MGCAASTFFGVYITANEGYKKRRSAPKQVPY